MKEIIHRGITSIKNKENTYLAIKKALKDKNSLGVEFDIRLTKDKRIVLSHNSIIGLNLIENMNYQDIIKEKYLDTLDKILTIDTDKILLIDIKEKDNYKEFGNVLLKELEKTNKNIYLASFSKRIINYIKKKSNYKNGYITFYYKNDKNDFIVINHKFISDKKIKKIKNKEIFLWTINNKKELDEIKKKFSNIDNYYLIIDKEE